MTLFCTSGLCKRRPLTIEGPLCSPDCPFYMEKMCKSRSYHVVAANEVLSDVPTLSRPDVSVSGDYNSSLWCRLCVSALGVAIKPGDGSISHNELGVHVTPSPSDCESSHCAALRPFTASSMKQGSSRSSPCQTPPMK